MAGLLVMGTSLLLGLPSLPGLATDCFPGLPNCLLGLPYLLLLRSFSGLLSLSLGRGLPSTEPSFRPALLALVLSINLATFGSMMANRRGSPSQRPLSPISTQ